VNIPKPPKTSTLSLVRALLPYVRFARHSLACDETGVVRAVDLNASGDVTRAEMEKRPEF
jgi:hypothetical protein